MSATPPPEIVLPSVPHLAGGLVAQLCVGLILAGITYSQAYSYMLMAASDPLIIKITVSLVVILETINSVFSIHIVYFFFVENFGNFLALGRIIWSVKGSSITVLTTILLARLFSVWRIYHLTRKNLFVTVPVGVIAIANFAVNLFGNISYVIKSDNWSEFLASKAANVIFIITASITAFEDIAIAAILIFCLSRMRTGFKRTDHSITVMIAYIVNTGAFTAMMSLLLLFTYCLMKDTSMFQGAYFLAGRAYGIAVIGTLNQRHYFRDSEPAIITDSDMPLSNMIQQNQIEHRTPIEVFKNVVRSSDDAASSLNPDFGSVKDRSAVDLKLSV